MIVLIDNHDSFAFILAHLVAEAVGEEPRVVRRDMMSAEDVLALEPQALIFSPGPGTPERAELCLDLLKTAPAELPIAGVCLGMQAMAVAFGGQVTRGPRPVHGEVHTIHHHGLGAFRFVESPLQATRYHSLAVVEESVPETLDITARTAEGEIMGLSHRTRPVHGVQFHPESIGTQHGAAMLRACLSEALI